MSTISNFAAIVNGHLLDQIEECVLYYDRRSDRPTVPEHIAEYVRGEHHLYLKQVPSCMTLRKAGSRLNAHVASVLMEDGFRLLPDFDQRLESSESDRTTVETADSESDDIPFVDDSPKGFYEDPFKILAGYAFASRYLAETPKIHVWPGGCHRIQGQIRPDLLGSDRKNKTSLIDVSSHAEKMHLLFNHTHWGHMIQEARRSGKNGREKSPIKFFSETLFRRISFLIKGRHDPLWTKEEREKFLVDDSPRNLKERMRRFLEVLKTVDGLFLQRYMSYPEERWDWQKFDSFVLQAISILITDEFFDGELTAEGLKFKCYYSQLKSSRKAFKLIIHQDEPSLHISGINDLPRWVQSFLGGTWKYASRTRGFERANLAGTLSQTRGSGTPPPLVVLQSKVKFLETVSETPPSLTRTEKALISVAMDRAVEKVPGHAFTGLATKARVTVTGSACWEETRKSGGTAQAILDLMAKYEDDAIPVHDLDNGNITARLRKDEFESIGTAVFYACLHEVLNTSPEELRKVYLTLVREPGKARSVTKGVATLKIVLDTVSKIVAWPLKKGFKSSESGMGRAHHAWNLFRDMFSDEMYDEVFAVERVEEDVFAGYRERTIVYEDIFAGSTDYQEATDRMVHDFARIVATKWLNRCGIPNLLKGIVFGVCFQPRTVFFTGTGPLKNYGELVDESTSTRKLTLYRGVLMGDPLTKVILHFSNIITREIGSGLTTGTIFGSFRNGNEARELYRKVIGEPPAQDATPRLG